jgi:hypothetical protein
MKPAGAGTRASTGEPKMRQNMSIADAVALTKEAQRGTGIISTIFAKMIGRPMLCVSLLLILAHSLTNHHRRY